MKRGVVANGFAVLVLLGCIAGLTAYESARERENGRQVAGSPSVESTLSATPATPAAENGAGATPARGVKARRFGPTAVVVKELQKPLVTGPTKEELEMKLFTTFANQPDEEKFSDYSTVNWEANYQAFAAAMLKKAEAQGLDAGSLGEVLELVLKDAGGKLGYLPVGAYQASLNGSSVWIVTVKWEAPGMSMDEVEGASLSHIRIFAYDRKTLKQVGFSTCG